MGNAIKYLMEPSPELNRVIVKPPVEDPKIPQLLFDLNIHINNKEVDKIVSTINEISKLHYTHTLNGFEHQNTSRYPSLIVTLITRLKLDALPIIQRLIKENDYNVNSIYTSIEHRANQQFLIRSFNNAQFLKITIIGILIELNIQDVSYYKFFLDNGYKVKNTYTLLVAGFSRKITIMEHLTYYPEMKEVLEFVKNYTQSIDEIKII